MGPDDQVSHGSIAAPTAGHILEDIVISANFTCNGGARSWPKRVPRGQKGLPEAKAQAH